MSTSSLRLRSGKGYCLIVPTSSAYIHEHIIPKALLKSAQFSVHSLHGFVSLLHQMTCFQNVFADVFYRRHIIRRRTAGGCIAEMCCDFNGSHKGTDCTRPAGDKLRMSFIVAEKMN